MALQLHPILIDAPEMLAQQAGFLRFANMPVLLLDCRMADVPGILAAAWKHWVVTNPYLKIAINGVCLMPRAKEKTSDLPIINEFEEVRVELGPKRSGPVCLRLLSWRKLAPLFHRHDSFVYMTHEYNESGWSRWCIRKLPHLKSGENVRPEVLTQENIKENRFIHSEASYDLKCPSLMNIAQRGIIMKYETDGLRTLPAATTIIHHSEVSTPGVQLGPWWSQAHPIEVGGYYWPQPSVWKEHPTVLGLLADAPSGPEPDTTPTTGSQDPPGPSQGPIGSLPAQNHAVPRERAPIRESKSKGRRRRSSPLREGEAKRALEGTPTSTSATASHQGGSKAHISRKTKSRSRSRDRDRHRRRRSYTRSSSRSQDKSSRKQKKSKHKRRRRSFSSGSERSGYSKSLSGRSSQDREYKSRGSTKKKRRRRSFSSGSEHSGYSKSLSGRSSQDQEYKSRGLTKEKRRRRIFSSGSEHSGYSKSLSGRSSQNREYKSRGSTKEKRRRRTFSSGSEHSGYSKSLSGRSSQDREYKRRRSTKEKRRRRSFSSGSERSGYSKSLSGRSIQDREYNSRGATKEKEKKDLEKEKSTSPVVAEPSVKEPKEVWEKEKLAFFRALKQIEGSSFIQGNFKSSRGDKSGTTDVNSKNGCGFNFGTQAELSS